jgi:hypothetical protein
VIAEPKTISTDAPCRERLACALPPFECWRLLYSTLSKFYSEAGSGMSRRAEGRGGALVAPRAGAALAQAG